MISSVGWLPPSVGHERKLELEPADIPFGTSLRYLLHWFRQTIDWAEAEGLMQLQ